MRRERVDQNAQCAPLRLLAAGDTAA